jgi:hypothetical protein
MAKLSVNRFSLFEEGADTFQAVAVMQAADETLFFGFEVLAEAIGGRLTQQRFNIPNRMR